MVFEASVGLVAANAGVFSHVRTKGLADVYKRTEGTGGEIVKDNPFIILVFMVILLVAGIAFTVWVIRTPDLPLWVKLLLLK